MLFGLLSQATVLFYIHLFFEVLTNQLICECHALLAESGLRRWVEDFDQSSVAWVHIGQRDLRHFLSDVA